MGLRGELFSSRIILPNRTYFFNVKENRMGDLYLNIVESKNRDNGGFDRQSVILFADDLQEFLKGFDESLKVLEKAVREKRFKGGAQKNRGENSKRDEKPDNKRPDQKRFEQKKFGQEKFPRERGERQRHSGDKGFKNRKDDRNTEKGARGRGNERGGERSSERRSDRGKRVVVKKRD